MSTTGDKAGRMRFQGRKWRALRRFLEYGFVGLVTLIAVSVLYQGIATYRDSEMYPPPGVLVNVGGYKLHIKCIGAGTPTVVLEAGRANGSLSWSKVQPEVAKITRACSYDRAGLGWSDPGPEPRTAQVIVNELHTLLRRAPIQGPFVLVGHSAGGYTVRVFASQYPDEVHGLVLVDSSNEDGQGYLSPERREQLMSQFRIARFGSSLGIVRLIGRFGLSSEFEKFLKRFPDNVEAVNRSIYYRSQTWKTGWEEFVADEESRAQVRLAHSLGGKPLIVLTAVGELENDEMKQAWLRDQAGLLRLSSRSTHVIAENSSHFIQLDEPGMVVEAVRQVIEAARNQ